MPREADVLWRFTTDPLSEKILRTAERTLGVVFPADYRECVRINHGGAPEPSQFSIEAGPDRKETRSVGLLLTLDPRESENVLETRAELAGEGVLPDGVIPIINDGEGHYVCLDYRNDSDRKQAEIVFWAKDGAGESGCLPLARDFSAFLAMLSQGGSGQAPHA